ncbi:MAG: peptidoglycan DD-metalloendopeptidase family protein [Bacteroidetes bacterium]|nr:peptidoglycan DD-metalloendopeptidase family protein [Bacteroidota bacterium]
MKPFNTIPLDFSVHNQSLKLVDLTDTAVFNCYVKGVLAASGACFGIGGYNEHREIYKRSNLFNENEDKRCIHLGIDVWTKEGTPIHSPFDAKVHSFKDNNNYGDYGPTLLLEHKLDNYTFFTLYGHLDPEVLNRFKIGQSIKASEIVGLTGNFPENGNWPPHLHFQLINDLKGAMGDYPGVCTIKERTSYLQNCPDPSILFSSCF